MSNKNEVNVDPGMDAQDPLSSASDALASVISMIGLDLQSNAVRVQGDDPVLASPFRLGAAMAAGIGAQAAAICEIWRIKTGRSQTAHVNLSQAIHACSSSFYLKQNDFAIGLGYSYLSAGNTFFRTRDGRHIRMGSLRPNLRDATLDLLQCSNSDAAIAAAVRCHDAAYWEEVAADLPLAMVRTQAEWREHPHGRRLVGIPPVKITKIGENAPVEFRPDGAPLEGLRVLDLSHVLAGPSLGRTLAEQGANVLRISPPRESDAIELCMDTGFGKRNAFLDFDRSDDAAKARELANSADIVVQSFSPGAMARRGLSAADIANTTRGVIYVSISCYGLDDGPWSSRIGFDPNAQAITGINATQGSLEEPARPPTFLLADYMTGYLGAAAVLSALIRRAREGGSYHVQLSLAQTCMWVQDLGMVTPHPTNALEPPHLLQMQSAFGMLEYLAPVSQYSETIAAWRRPPQPMGASIATW